MRAMHVVRENIEQLRQHQKERMAVEAGDAGEAPVTTSPNAAAPVATAAAGRGWEDLDRAILALQQQLLYLMHEAVSTKACETEV